MLDLYVYTINLGGQQMAALSLLTPDEVDRYGLVSEAVLGEVDPRRPDMTIENFTANEDFLTLMHRIVAHFAPELPVVQKQAEKLKNGPVYVIDRRTVDAGRNHRLKTCLAGLPYEMGRFNSNRIIPIPITNC